MTQLQKMALIQIRNEVSKASEHVCLCGISSYSEKEREDKRNSAVGLLTSVGLWVDAVLNDPK